MQPKQQDSLFYHIFIIPFSFAAFLCASNVTSYHLLESLWPRVHMDHPDLSL